MKIDSGLSGYQYPNRTVGIDRRQEEPQQSETRATARGAGTISGAFPNSLASALWVMGTSETEADMDFQPAAISQDWVQGLYQEFA